MKLAYAVANNQGIWYFFAKILYKKLDNADAVWYY